MTWISFGALFYRKKIIWWQLASRCWNGARPWHASELVSFLVGLRTYQHPGIIYFFKYLWVERDRLSLTKKQAKPHSPFLTKKVSKAHSPLSHKKASKAPLSPLSQKKSKQSPTLPFLTKEKQAKPQTPPSQKKASKAPLSPFSQKKASKAPNSPF